MAQLGDTIIKGDLEVLGDCNIQGTLMLQGLLNLFYPVGSYYETSDTNFDPNVSWGGTWVQDTVGLSTIAADIDGDTDLGKTNNRVRISLGEILGEKKHTLSASEIPEFSFTINHVAYGEKACTGIKNVTAKFRDDFVKNELTYEGAKGTGQGYCEQYDFGGGSSHNNVQPSIGVVRWHRTA